MAWCTIWHTTCLKKISTERSIPHVTPVISNGPVLRLRDETQANGSKIGYKKNIRQII